MVDKNDVYKKYSYALITGGITFFGAILVLSLVIFPMSKYTASLFSEASSKRTTLNELKAKKVELEKLSQREAEITTEEKRVTNALPPESEVGRVFIQLDQLVTDSGGSTQSIFKSNATSLVANGVNVVSTSYNIPTTFPNYYAYKEFLARSATALRLLNINSVQISAADSGQISSNLVTDTFSRK